MPRTLEIVTLNSQTWTELTSGDSPNTDHDPRRGENFAANATARAQPSPKGG